MPSGWRIHICSGVAERLNVERSYLARLRRLDAHDLALLVDLDDDFGVQRNRRQVNRRRRFHRVRRGARLRGRRGERRCGGRQQAAASTAAPAKRSNVSSARGRQTDGRRIRKRRRPADAVSRAPRVRRSGLLRNRRNGTASRSVAPLPRVRPRYCALRGPRTSNLPKQRSEMPRLFAVVLVAVAVGIAPVRAERPIVDLHRLDAYFELFAADSSVPWKPTTVRLDTYSSAPVAFAVYQRRSRRRADRGIEFGARVRSSPRGGARCFRSTSRRPAAISSSRVR